MQPVTLSLVQYNDLLYCTSSLILTCFGPRLQLQLDNYFGFCSFLDFIFWHAILFMLGTASGFLLFHNAALAAESTLALCGLSEQMNVIMTFLISVFLFSLASRRSNINKPNHWMGNPVHLGPPLFSSALWNKRAVISLKKVQLS